MAALTELEITGRITWIGVVPDRGASIQAEARSAVMARFAGIEGEAHGGLTRASCIRFKDQHPQGTEIRNSRQLTILSVEEMAEIAAAMGLDRLAPEWLGASLVVRGIPDLSHLPPGTRLQTPRGTTITLDLENGPCIHPGKEIEAAHPGFGPKFKPAARGRRGTTGWIEREGPLSVGDAVRLHVPTQGAWMGATIAPAAE